MFHYYFLGNPEGIGFDAPDTDYLSGIWNPLARFLEARGTAVRTGTAARSITPDTGTRWRVELGAGPPLCTRHLVLALDPGGLRALLAASPELAAAAPELAGQVAALALAPPFAVTRLWLDRDVGSERDTFSAVSREPTLDSVTVYSRLERRRRTGPSAPADRSSSCTPTRATLRTSTPRPRGCAPSWPRCRRRPGRPGRARPAATGGHRAELPAGQRRHAAPGAGGRPRTAPGRRLRAHAVPDRADGTRRGVGGVRRQRRAGRGRHRPRGDPRDTSSVACWPPRRRRWVLIAGDLSWARPARIRPATGRRPAGPAGCRHGAPRGSPGPRPRPGGPRTRSTITAGSPRPPGRRPTGHRASRSRTRRNPAAPTARGIP